MKSRKRAAAAVEETPPPPTNTAPVEVKSKSSRKTKGEVPAPKPIIPENVSAPKPSGSTVASTSSAPAKKKKKNKDSSSSSDEERWLEKIKDPKLMTARQRAMYDRENGERDMIVPAETLMSLPTGYKEKVLSAEATERALVKAAKRKQLADEKREKDKQKTMDRLLKKQESKFSKGNKTKQLKTCPVITYKSTLEQPSILIFPPDFDLKLGGGGGREGKTEAGHENTISTPSPARITQCAICKERKRYNCSKTNTPLCSYRCYLQLGKKTSPVGRTTRARGDANNSREVEDKGELKA